MGYFNVTVKHSKGSIIDKNEKGYTTYRVIFDADKRYEKVLKASLCTAHDKFLADNWEGKRVVVHSKSGSYFCVLKSIQLSESYCYVKVDDAWLVNLGRQKTSDNELIKNCSLSTISISRVYGGKEFEIKDVINIDTSEDIINQMRRIVEELKS